MAEPPLGEYLKLRRSDWQWQISSQRYRREIVWKTEEIDIGTAKRISIAVDAIKIGNFEESDSLRIYYRLGDGDELIELSFIDPQEDFETSDSQTRSEYFRTSTGMSLSALGLTETTRHCIGIE